MKPLYFTLCFFLTIPHFALAQAGDPDSARIVTEDLGRFWQAFDRAAPAFAPETFDQLYLSKGSLGLQDFTKLRIANAKELAAAIRAHPKYYASIRASTQRLGKMEPGMRAAFYALKYLYPEAVFPDVYFLIGRMNSGGTTSERALLIGAEMYGKTPEMPGEELGDWHRQVLKPVEEVPHIVAHELVHYQQKYDASTPTLLAQSIKEGSADFIAELISGRHINAHVHEYANPREAKLWQEFKEKMRGQDFSGWYDSGPDGRPKDLGYWMGYKITEAFYRRAPNKRAAIKQILEIADFEAFLQESGYAKKFGQ